MLPTLSTWQRAAISRICAKTLLSSAVFSRRKVQTVSWSGCVSAHNSRTATFSWVLRSICRLENTPVA